MSQLKYLIRDGIQRGWKVSGGALGAIPEKIVCDVAIIGSGAGAGITAELLSRAGLQVLIIEKGTLQEQYRFQPAGGRSLSFALPGKRGAQDRRQGDQHFAGPLRRRLDHGDFELAQGKVTALICRNVKPNGALAHAERSQGATEIVAKHYVLAGGPGFGQGQHDLLASFPHKHTLLALLALLALLRDGFHDDAPGGKVKLRSDGSAVLTLYGAVNCLAQGLVKNLTGRDVTLA